MHKQLWSYSTSITMINDYSCVNHSEGVLKSCSAFLSFTCFLIAIFSFLIVIFGSLLFVVV